MIVVGASRVLKDSAAAHSDVVQADEDIETLLSRSVARTQQVREDKMRETEQNPARQRDRQQQQNRAIDRELFMK